MKSTYYNKDYNNKDQITVHIVSCPQNVILPYGIATSSTKEIGIHFVGNSSNYNYLVDKIKSYCIYLGDETSEFTGLTIKQHQYEHKSKDLYIEYYKYLTDDGMLYVIRAEM